MPQILAQRDLSLFSKLKCQKLKAAVMWPCLISVNRNLELKDQMQITATAQTCFKTDYYSPIVRM